MLEKEETPTKIRQSWIAATTRTKNNEEDEDHIIIALHEYEKEAKDKDYTYMIDISKNDEIIFTKDFHDDEKGAYKIFHDKQIEYFKRILII